MRHISIISRPVKQTYTDLIIDYFIFSLSLFVFWFCFVAVVVCNVTKAFRTNYRYSYMQDWTKSISSRKKSTPNKTKMYRSIQCNYPLSAVVSYCTETKWNELNGFLSTTTKTMKMKKKKLNSQVSNWLDTQNVCLRFN